MKATSTTLVFVDIETAGLNPKRHPIIQIAAVAVDAGLNPLEAFEAKILFDEHSARRHALRKNHFSRGLWAKEALDPQEAATRFSAFLRRHASFPMLSAEGRAYNVAQLVAHNASFDGEFLRTWYDRLGVFLPARRSVLCTLQRALWFFSESPSPTPPRDFKLATLCQYFGVSFHAASAHEALADVSATVALYRALIDRAGSIPPLGPLCGVH